MNAQTQRNLSKVNDYIATLYPPEKSKRGAGVSRPSPQAIKAGLAYLSLMTGDSKQTRTIAQAMFGKKWCNNSNRLTNWIAQGKHLLIQHAPYALPRNKAYHLVLKLKGSHGAKL